MPEMTEAMARAVLAFLHEVWPVQRESEPDRQGWDHMSSTAYQIACMALVALGEAEETVWGAVPKQKPRLPEVLPFWEDMAVAVLWLAGQQNVLTYRQMDGGVPEPRKGGMAVFVVKRLDAPPPPSPNILAGRGTGPARAADMVLPMLEALELVAQGRWTEAAECVLWRGSGRVWDISFEDDPRFLAAVEAAVRTVPDAVRLEIDAAMRISEADIAASVERSLQAREEMQLRFGRPSLFPAQTAEHVRKWLPRERENRLDWIFFRRWRLGRGWLEETQAGRALEIFHDRLAIAMRRTVIARLYPGGFVWE